MRNISVVVADDHELVRASLRLLLETSPDIKVVGEAKDGQEAVRQVTALHPNVAIMDLAMPCLNGLQATRQILKAAPASRVLMVSAHSSQEEIEEALAAGVSGYFMKEDGGETLLKGIREVAEGRTFCSPVIAAQFKNRRKAGALRGDLEAGQSFKLTDRHKEVLRLIAEGYLTKQIADVLSISSKTVEKHRQELMNRLNMHNIAMLTRYAVRSGLVQPNPNSLENPVSIPKAPLQP